MRRGPIHPDEYGGEDLNTDEKLIAEGWSAGLDVWDVLADAIGDAVSNGALANAQLWSLREAVRAEALAESKPAHIPRRGSDVEGWIKLWRDSERFGSNAWHQADAILDDYRLKADTGTPLDRDVSYPGES